MVASTLMVQPQHITCRHNEFRYEDFRSALSASAIADIRNGSQPVFFEKDALIFKAATAADQVLGIESGCIARTSDVTGNGQCLTSDSKQTIFGLIEALAGSPHPFDLRAATPISGWTLSTTRLLEILRDHPQLCLRVVTLIASMYNETIPQIM